MAACAHRSSSTPAIGEAYTGPAELKIRGDIPLGSPVVDTVHHGDRLDILRQRRRVFLYVRTPKGIEGWTEARQLLSSDEMDELQDLAERAGKMPSQGVATTWDDLRIHTQPALQAPGFLMLRQNDKCEVLGHVVMSREGFERPPLIAPAPKKEKVARKPARAPKIPPPPMPAPPKPPANWLEMSHTELPEPAEPPPPPKPVPTDDWSLVRFRGQTGWVLTRLLYMAIPDEVAQYAEGRRIVSYFPLGEVQDGDLKKKNWLWTTVSGRQPFDFDSFRVFIWSLRRRRYETAYIERNIKGYGPVLLKDVELSTGARGDAATTKYPGFSLCVEKADGQRYRREYAFMVNVVRFAGERPCEAQQPLLAQALAPTASAAANGQPVPAQKAPLVQRLKEKWKAITRRWFRH